MAVRLAGSTTAESERSINAHSGRVLAGVEVRPVAVAAPSYAATEASARLSEVSAVISEDMNSKSSTLTSPVTVSVVTSAGAGTCDFKSPAVVLTVNALAQNDADSNNDMAEKMVLIVLMIYFMIYITD